MVDLGNLEALRGRTFAAVIFDNDGTLVDSTPAVERSWLQWAKEYGVDPRELGKHHGVPAAAIISAIAPDVDRVEALARVTELELSDTGDVVALPGAVDAVSALLPARCAIATSATRELGLARLQAAGIPLPDVVITIDDVERGKPSPDPFLAAAEKLGVDPERCLVVEDAPSGLQAARSAGCATLALTSTTPASLLDADAIVADLTEVIFTQSDSGVMISAAK